MLRILVIFLLMLAFIGCDGDDDSSSGGSSSDSSSEPVIYLADQDDDEIFDLFHNGVEGGDLVQLTNFSSTDVDVQDFQISPNREKVVYIADADDDEVFELFSVSINGDDLVRLSSNLSGGSDVESFQISSDSNHVVYIADESDDDFELYSVDINGGTPVNINGSLPSGDRISSFAISPNSNKVVYLEIEDGANPALGELYSVDMDGDNLTEISEAPAAGRDDPAFEFRITANSSNVVYSAFQDSDTLLQLYSTPIGGGDSTRIADENVDIFFLSSDNDHAIFLGNSAQPFELYQSDIGNLDSSVKIATASTFIRVFRISDNGDQIVFRSDENSTGIFELFSIPVNGSLGDAVQLNASGQEVEENFVISSDSSKVVYQEGSSLFSVDIDGSNREELSSDLDNGAQPFQVSDDGDFVVFKESDNELFSIDIDGGTAINLSTELIASGGVSLFGILDSSRVVYTADQEVDNLVEIYSVPINGLDVDEVSIELSSVTGDGDVVDFVLDYEEEENFGFLILEEAEETKTDE